MLIGILSIIAIICLFLAVDHAISDIYQYKYVKNIAEVFKDSDTEQLFVYLRPYIADCIEIMRKNSENYAKDTKSMQDYRQFLRYKHSK